MHTITGNTEYFDPETILYYKYAHAFKYTHVAGSGNMLHLQNCQIPHSFIVVPNSPYNMKAAKTNQLRSLIRCHRQKQNTNPDRLLNPLGFLQLVMPRNVRQ